MGAPFHEWQKLCDKNILFAFSSNYALYGDMSHRVMTSLKYFCPDIEIYSIDEAFLSLDQFQKINLLTYAATIRNEIKKWTGLPVSVGIAPTKTLAKMANHIAKKNAVTGVFDLSDPDVQEKVLAEFPIADIWGVGRKLAKRLQDLNIYTARDLRDANLKMIRMHFSVVMECVVEELRGTSCIPLEMVQPRKQIMSSRSFGKLVTELSELEEAVSYYTAKACLKLRKQNSVAGGISVFLQTNFFRKNDEQYSNSIHYRFATPSSDNGFMVSIAKKCLKNIFRKGYRYQKAGIMLLDLSPRTIKQYDLLSIRENKSELLMQTVDLINHKWGNRMLFMAAEGIKRNWKTRCNRLSSRYTTQWHELAKVYCKNA